MYSCLGYNRFQWKEFNMKNWIGVALVGIAFLVCLEILKTVRFIDGASWDQNYTATQALTGILLIGGILAGLTGFLIIWLNSPELRLKTKKAWKTVTGG